MRLFKDENGNFIPKQELRKEFEMLKLTDPDSYGYSFENYIRNCTDKNGTLTELRRK